MNWSKLVKDLRQEMILSQQELANKLGVAFCTINRYEKGYYNPTIKVQRELKKMAKSYKLDWDKYRKG